MARLVLIHPTESDLEPEFRLPVHPVVIGRGRECEILLNQDGISRRHARISCSPDGWFIEDLGSTNGSFINDQPVERALLRDADFLKVGFVILKFDVHGDAAPPANRAGGEGSSSAPAAATLRLKPRA